MSQFLYQDYFEVLDPPTIEFEGGFPDILELLPELVYDWDIDDYTTIPILVENIFDDIIEFKDISVTSEETDDADDYTVVVPPASFDFFDPVFDDTLQIIPDFNIYESGNNESWEGLNVPPDDYGPMQHNFGKPYAPGLCGIGGQYVCPHTPSSGVFALVADTIYYIPFKVPYNIHITEFGLWVATIDVGKEARIAIYNSQRGEVKKLIYNNVLALNSTGYRMTPADLWLTEGVYFLAVISDSSAAEVKASFVDDPILGYKAADDCSVDSFYYSMYQQSQAYTDGFPNTADGLDIFTGDVPTVIMRLE